MKIKEKFKTFFSKLKDILIKLYEKILEIKKRRESKPKSKFAIFMEKYHNFFEKYAIFLHIVIALFLCFLIELMARHSFVKTFIFVRDHTIPYLYNAFIIYVFLSLCFITKRRSFVRIFVLGIFFILGLINGILLLQRVSPFGFTDFYMITDLLTMQDTKYFSLTQEIMTITGFALFFVLLVILFFKGHTYKTKTSLRMKLVFPIIMFISLPLLTLFLQRTNKLAAYFGNLAQGYSDYGYLYGFSSSVVDIGMKKPLNYSEHTINRIMKSDDKEVGNTTLTQKKAPNIVVVLLESYFDPYDCKYLKFSKDPAPFFHYLQKNYSTGHFVSPVVGAGTCNTEFEVLTGMSCRFLGPGEYPQKTILKKRSCESAADVLKSLNYVSHVVHNNGGNFYSRKNAFSQMGFNTFTAKENLDITEYTPLGTWPTDPILINATKDAMDSTKGQDFIYTITVGTHGAYPTYKVLDNPPIKVTAEGKSEAERYAWEYYINQIHEMDKWMKAYVKSLSERKEDTILIMFGDHLPTMGLLDSDMKTGSIYHTNYVTWNNFNMPKKDMDLAAYQLLPEYFNRLGIHNGTIFKYNQHMTNNKYAYNSIAYLNGLENLQYDLLYGKKYAYKGKDLFPATDIIMGIKDIVINKVYTFGGKVHIYGDNFNKWSYVYVNDKQVPTHYESGQVLTISKKKIKDNDIITVSQVGSGSDIFRTSKAFVYSDPQAKISEGIFNNSSDIEIEKPKLNQPDEDKPNVKEVEN